MPVVHNKVPAYPVVVALCTLCATERLTGRDIQLIETIGLNDHDRLTAAFPSRHLTTFVSIIVTLRLSDKCTPIHIAYLE